ncbi:hypothetical protein [Parasphingorhabdus pacifica]
MTRRSSLPGAAELFRTTSPGQPGRVGVSGGVVPADTGSTRTGPAEKAGRVDSGRRKHDAKITVYVSDEELLGLEQARLALRADHGIAVDRGRVVREAVAVVLADLGERGEDSVLVRRLREETGE